MITIVAIILAMLIVIFEKLRGILILFLVCLITYMLIKEYKNRKYNRNPLKQIKETSHMEYALMMINNCKCYKKYLVKDNNILLVMENGIYFIKVLDYRSKITGYINDDYLNKLVGNKQLKVKNEIKKYNEEYSLYQEKIDYKIKKYIIIRNDCMMHIDAKDINIVNNKNFFFEIDKKNKKYTNEQIDMIYEKINM